MDVGWDFDPDGSHAVGMRFAGAPGRIVDAVSRSITVQRDLCAVFPANGAADPVRVHGSGPDLGLAVAARLRHADGADAAFGAANDDRAAERLSATNAGWPEQADQAGPGRVRIEVGRL